jgi:Ca2+:H+ antiporter
MDLALGVALGSCLQIAIFVLPACVLAGWAMGSVDAAGDPFALDLDPFLVLTLTLSVVLAYFVTADGRSNWLLGLELVVAYCLIGLVFLVKKEPGGGGGGGKAPAAALLL